MTYFLKRFKPQEKYTLCKTATTKASESEADVHEVGNDFQEAKNARDAANEKIESGELLPLGDWRSGMSNTLSLEED